MEVSKASVPPFRELLASELRLDPRQWEEAPRKLLEEAAQTDMLANPPPPPEAVLDIDCLVHQEWMRGVKCGHAPSPTPPPLPAEEMHWLLQRSCDCPTPKHWQRVSILCIRKNTELDTPTNTTAAKRFIIPHGRDYSKESIHELLTQISQENLLASWQEVLQSMHPTPTTTPRQPTPAYVRELIYKLYHTEVCLLRQSRVGGHRKKSSGRETSTSSPGPSGRQGKETNTVGNATTNTPTKCQATSHANLSPLLAALESSQAFYLVFPYTRFTLFDVAIHSPAMFNDSAVKPLFVLFQLLKVLEHCHKTGVTLGAFSLESVSVDSRLWVQLRIPAEVLRLVRNKRTNTTAAAAEGDVSGGKEGRGGQGRAGERSGGGELRTRGKEREETRERQEKESRLLGLEDGRSASASTLADSELESEGELTDSAKDTSTESSPAKRSQQQTVSKSDKRLPTSLPPLPPIPLAEAVKKWQHGDLDNFTYIMLLNHHAGRQMGDPNNHPIFPWVSNFSHPSRSFRDLTKSKHRLNKGDNQLNFTYASAREEFHRGGDQDGPIPHHVGDILTDVTYYVYKARQTPKDVLCTHVRPRWVPEEYPGSIEKMYIWTPDECIPEFYTDPLIFKSIHADLPDLGLPVWCPSPEMFVTSHRRLLEGDYVSSQLHHWIDLTFGYKLSGEAAVRAMNVYVSLVDKHKNPRNHGIVQLFRSSHPKRVHCSPASVALLEWESYLGQSSVSDGASFPVNHREVSASLVQVLVPRSSDGEKAPIRTLESIVEQQTQSLRVGGEGGEGADGTPCADILETPHEMSDNNSSFEQLKIPDESFGSTPSSYPDSTVGISYGDSPLESQQAGPVRYPVKQREGAVLNGTQVQTAQQNRFRVAKYFRQRKQNVSDGSGDEYPWQNSEIALPKDCHVLHRLLEQEERAHFVSRCCKDFADTLTPAWEQRDIEEASLSRNPSLLPLVDVLEHQRDDPLFSPSLEERVTIDIASATVTVVELCCIKELRVATRTNASLLERVRAIRTLLSSGQLHLPSYLQNLAEFVLLSDVKKTPFDHFPRLSSSLFLQPFVPVILFPPYFEQVYAFASKLELFCRDAGLKKYHESQQLAIKPLSPPSPLHTSYKSGILEKIMTLVSENLQPLVQAAQGEGFVLLLLHLYPLFQYPETSFDMIQTHLDTLGMHLSHVQMHRLFMNVLLHFFDNSHEPHQQGYLLSRSMSDFLIRRFGLHAFLAKFLEFFLEAVLEPERLSNRGVGVRKNVFRLKESESILMLLPSTELGHSLNLDEQKRQVSDFTFSVDLSEVGGGYNSEREFSSGESDTEFVPESSLLARTGVMLSSLGTSAGDIDEEEGERREGGPGREGESQGSLRQRGMMLLPQFTSSGGRETADSALQYERPRSQSMRGNDESGLAETGSGSEREIAKTRRGSSPNMTRSGSTSIEFRASLDSPIDNTLSLEGLGLEESLVSFNTASHSSHLLEGYPPPQHPNILGGVAEDLSGRESGEFLTVREREGEGFVRGVVGGERNWGRRDESEGEGEGGGEGEENEKEKMTTNVRNDPEVAAINRQIAELAGDCLCWLLRRLGPLLASRHIVNPLLAGMHRCFTGILDRGGRETVTLKCLGSMAKLYGDSVLFKLYLPRVEGWVLAATNRMSVKAEANLAAALALVRLITQRISDEKLEKVTSALCESFFIPLIQLLSSQTVFPSGSKARATICHSLVLLLIKTGEKLGRDRSYVLLLETLQLFFTCFDAATEAHQQPSVTTSTRSSTQAPAPGTLTDGDRERSCTEFPPTSSGVPRGSSQPKKTVSLDREETLGATSRGDPSVTSHPLSSNSNKPFPAVSAPDVALEQLHATFSPAMAHATYIPFCKLLGQIKLNTELRNTELIEQIAYSYDNENVRKENSLPSVFTTGSEKEQSSSSNSENEDSTGEERTEDDIARDVTIKVGPIVALQRRWGLDEDAVTFGRSSWFVDLYQESGDQISSTSSGVTSGVDRGSENQGTAGVSGVSGGGIGVSSGVAGSTEVPRSVIGEEAGGGRGWMEGVRGSAMATASGILQLIQSRPPVPDAAPQGPAVTKTDFLTRNSVNFDTKFQAAANTQPGQALPERNLDDGDCVLSGQWSELWESQLTYSPHSQELYSHFMGRKLQTYTGHKGSVRSLAVSDTEHFFLSASKDKTAKLWLLRNQGDGSAHLSPQLTYAHHQKAVTHVQLVSSTGNAISCDGTVHLWDTECGYGIHQFSSPRGREFVAMTCLLPPQPVAVVATNDLALRFIDFRARTLQHTWKLHFTTGGILRYLVCGDNWLAVGNNGGVINTLDLRTGEILHQWRPSDYPVAPTTTWNENLFGLRASRHGNLVTSVGPGIMHLWRPSTGKLLSHIRGQSSTTPCLESLGEQLISASSNGHIVIHNCFERTKDPASSQSWGTKVRSKELKGGVTSIAALQETRLLLLGSDNGQVVLMS